MSLQRLASTMIHLKVNVDSPTGGEDGIGITKTHLHQLNTKIDVCRLTEIRCTCRRRKQHPIRRYVVTLPLSR